MVEEQKFICWLYDYFNICQYNRETTLINLEKKIAEYNQYIEDKKSFITKTIEEIERSKKNIADAAQNNKNSQFNQYIEDKKSSIAKAIEEIKKAKNNIAEAEQTNKNCQELIKGACQKIIKAKENREFINRLVFPKLFIKKTDILGIFKEPMRIAIIKKCEFIRCGCTPNKAKPSTYFDVNSGMWGCEIMRKLFPENCEIYILNVKSKCEFPYCCNGTEPTVIMDNVGICGCENVKKQFMNMYTE
jgi:hypothetical protein